MSKRRATGGDLVKLWLLTAFVIGCCIWVLSQSTVDCQVEAGTVNAGRCVATSMAHGFAPYLPWVMIGLGGLTVIATLRFLLRRR
ncbi:hypothetical protein ACFRFH_09020 [Leifsonia sp. NPDC056824]|uniref:hypothetical protein n=1 Tax=Leifsonia sp. NPDC056824 TaxID=3345953 RepID=UPI003689ADCC